MYEKKILGNLGEDIACKFILNKGYEIVERNFYCRQGEIDIIAKDKNEIVFIEVKSRSSIQYGCPSEAVNKQKIRHLYRTAKYYLYKNKYLNNYIRFDVIEILIKNGKLII